MDEGNAVAPCPSEQEWHDFIAGDLTGISHAKLQLHLGSCLACQKRNALLLNQHEALVSCLRNAAFTPTIERAEPPRTPQSEIPGFKLVRELGRGGFGIVYEAQQDRPRRPVALKVIRAGRYVDQQYVKLFQREVQVLARLKHPFIGAIYDAGRTDAGEHFFAMELIRGRALRDHVRQEQLDVVQRLDLFRKICDAIHYAHQKGVMHRDLKPSNILVDADGNPKILDFGLAKITDTDLAVTTVLTDIGQIAGTLPYMSPEQARGNSDEIDIRSDVYSLGVILYELLTEKLPYEIGQAALHEAVRVICEVVPQRPSTIIRTLRGDLETIALKALEKEPRRRYQSAAALGEDLQRYLTNQPILARPGSAMYQLRKLVVRHKGPFAFAATLIFVITAFGACMGVLYRRAETTAQREIAQRVRADALTAQAAAARDDAQRAHDRSEKIKSFLVDTLRSPDPSYGGKPDARISQVMRHAAARLQSGQFSDQPDVAAEVLHVIATVMNSVTGPEMALPLYESALERRRELYKGDNIYLAQSLVATAACLRDARHPVEALPRLTEALAMSRRLYRGDHVNLAHALAELGGCLKMLNRAADALPLFEEALAMNRRLYPGDHPDVAASLSNVGWCLWVMDKPSSGLSVCEQALHMYQRIYVADHPFIASCLNNVAACLLDLGRATDAVPKYKAALKMRQRIYKNADHPSIVESLNNVGAGLLGTEQWTDSLASYKLAIDMGQRLDPVCHWTVRASQIGAADALTELKQFDDAEKLLLEAWPDFDIQPTAPIRQKKRCLEAFVRLYEARHATDSTAGFAKRAAKWRERLADFKASTQPAR